MSSSIDMDPYVTVALDTLKQLCENPAQSQELNEYRDNSDKLRAAEAILQHARERNVQVSITGHVPVRPITRGEQQA